MPADFVRRTQTVQQDNYLSASASFVWMNKRRIFADLDS
jgi:hypothetical protein